MAKSVKGAVAGAFADDVGVYDYSRPATFVVNLHAPGADFVAISEILVGKVLHLHISELTADQSLQIHQPRGRIHTVRIPQALKQRLGRRILLPVYESSQVACPGLLGGSTGELLVGTPTESTGNTLNTARPKAGSSPLFTAGQIAQACTKCCAFDSSGKPPQ